MAGTVAVVQESRLFVSEPNPRWFGNSPNPSDTKAEAGARFLRPRFHVISPYLATH